MAIIDIHKQLQELVQQALKGEEIIVAKSGKLKSKPRKGGQLKGMLIVEDNFDDPLPEEFLKSFYEGDGNNL